MVSGLPDYHRYIVPSPVVVDAKVGSAFVAEYDSTPEDLDDGGKGPLLVDIKGRLYVVQYEKDREVDHTKIKGTALKDPTVDESVPISIENPAIAYDAVNDRFKVDIKALTANEMDISDDATRLLGIVYGSQGQKLLQRATTYDLIAQLRHAGAEIDPRNIRALTASDVVTIQEPLGIDDHGGSITVDGSVTVSATNLDIRDLAKTLDEIYVVLRTDAGAAYDGRQVTIQSQANPFTNDINVDNDDVETLLAGGLPAALDAGALKIKEQSPLTSIDIGNFPADYPDSAVATLLGGGLPSALVSDKLKVRASEIETILGEVQASPTANTVLARLKSIEGYTDGLEGLLAGGLPAALDGVSLKVKEQSPLSEIDVDIAKVLNSALAHTNPLIVRISDGSAFFDPLKQGEYVVARGSQAQALVQEATNYRLGVQPYGSQGQHLQQKATTYELLTDPVDRAARLLGVVYGSAGQKLAQEAASPYELQVSLNQDNLGLALETGGNLATIAGDTTSLDGKIPSDPSKESGKLTEIDTVLDNIYGKINDLEDALDSVATDYFRVLGKTGDPLFSIEDALGERKRDINASQGVNTLATTAVPAGKIHVITNICAYNEISGNTLVTIAAIIDGNARRLKAIVSPTQFETCNLQCAICLGPGDYITATFHGCTLGDDIYLDITHYSMDA